MPRAPLAASPSASLRTGSSPAATSKRTIQSRGTMLPSLTKTTAAARLAQISRRSLGCGLGLLPAGRFLAARRLAGRRFASSRLACRLLSLRLLGGSLFASRRLLRYFALRTGFLLTLWCHDAFSVPFYSRHRESQSGEKPGLLPLL